MSLRYETSLRETKQMTNLHEEYKVISILFIFLHPRVVHPTNGCPSLLAVVAGQRLHLGGYEWRMSNIDTIDNLDNNGWSLSTSLPGWLWKRMFTSAQNQSKSIVYWIWYLSKQTIVNVAVYLNISACFAIFSVLQNKPVHKICQFYGTIVHRIQLLRERHMYR